MDNESVLIDLGEITIVTAQPCEVYFLWQLDIQLLNFFELGYKKKEIHVLFAQPSESDLIDTLNDFIFRNNDYATFFLYKDTRKNYSYASTVRPHLIKKHILSHGRISRMLYIDSDVVFKRKLRIDSILNDDNHYVSDTQIYLNSKYVVSFASHRVLRDLADIVGISVKEIVLNDENCGGAQYLLKDLDVDFWNKVEEDAEKIFLYLEKQNLRKREREILGQTSDNSKIQSWCADMWAVFYNLIYFGKNVRIADELAFCWPWEKSTKSIAKSIIHYSGHLEAEKGSYFSKTLYRDRVPYYDFMNLSLIDNESVSGTILNYIRKLEQGSSKLRKKTDLVLVLDLSDSSVLKERDIVQCLCYYQKMVDIKLIVYTKEEIPLLNNYIKYNSDFSYFFGRKEGINISKTGDGNMLICKDLVVFPIEVLDELSKVEPDLNEFIEIVVDTINMTNFLSLFLGRYLNYDILSTLKDRIYCKGEKFYARLFKIDSLHLFSDMPYSGTNLPSGQVKIKSKGFKFNTS